MIPRYDKKEISSLWTEEYKFHTLLEVELAIMEAQEETGGGIPRGTAAQIRQTAKIRPERINEIENQVHHDIIAFCSSVTEQLPLEVGKYFHFGVTSSDIIDTGLSLQIKRSLLIIFEAFEDLLQTMLKLAQDTRTAMTMGRSHGMYAEPMSFGQKILGHYAEFYRRYQELKEFYEKDCTAQFSGAVGNYTILTTEQEKIAAQILGLPVESVSTQVLPRDRIGKLLSVNALLGSAIERIGVELRHLQRSEVAEVQEGFAPGQKGSSTMPHKKNPISGENLSGLSRIIRSHAMVGLENMVLWHERDISHSSSERMMLPDNFGLVFYCLVRLKNTLADLQVNRQQMEKRVTENFGYLSSFYLHHLLQHSSLSREDIYRIVQEAAFTAGKEGNGGSEVFYSSIVKGLGQREKNGDQALSRSLPRPSLPELQKIYLREVDKVFERTMNLYPAPKESSLAH